MSVDTRIRAGLAEIEAELPEVDTFELYDELDARIRKHRQRRTSTKLVAVAAAVVLGAVLATAQLGDDRAAPEPVPSDWVPPSDWVLVTSRLVGLDYAPPVGDEWSEPVREGATTYPYWSSVDAARQRFLVNADRALEVWRPGRAEPLLRFECEDDGGTGCLGAAAGPGPRDVTMLSGDLHLVVADTDGVIKDDLGPMGDGLMNRLAWAPDGSVLAVARTQHDSDTGSLEVTLREPGVAQETTLFTYSEQAPSWYDPEQHRFGDGPGMFNDWKTPRVTDLQWSPDSTRLAFTVATTPEGVDDSDRHVRWQLYVADPSAGTVKPLAELGRCTEPVDANGRTARVCDQRPALAWTPDGTHLTALVGNTLATYDLTGEKVRSETTSLNGPIVWVSLE